MVPVNDLLFGNVGGHFWNNVKTDPGFRPDWKIVSKSRLWSDENRYRSTVWKWLCEGSEDFTVSTSSKTMAQDQGRLLKMTVDVGDKVEFMALGSVPQLIKTRGSIDVVLIEVADCNHPLDDSIITAIVAGSKQQGGAKFIFVCTLEAAQRLQADHLPKLLQPEAPLAGYKMRTVVLFFARDDALGPRQPGVTSVARIALLFSLTPFRTGVGYVASTMNWHPVAIRQLVTCMDLTGNKLARSISFLQLG